MQASTINEHKLHDLLGRTIVDFGGCSMAPLVVIGDRLGLYRELTAHGPLTSTELAARTKTHERYVREWSNAQAASGYVSYDAQTGRYSMTPEQALLFAQEDSPAFIVGAFQTSMFAGRMAERLTESFRTGEGIGWHEHHHELFHGIERFFRSGYVGNLVQTWLPALNGVEAKLHAGAQVADIGCGHGASTIIMAEAFPKSQFIGFDYHPESIAEANARARSAGVAANCRFEVASAKDFPARNYDLVTVFDALHDMGDPAGASRHVLTTLAPDGRLDDRRAVRGRSRRGEPEPRRPRVLRGLDADVHAVLARAGSRNRARRAGRRSASARDRDGRGVHALQARAADAVQSRLRGAAVSRSGGRMREARATATWRSSRARTVSAALGRTVRAQERADLPHGDRNPLGRLLPRIDADLGLRREHHDFHRDRIWMRRDVVG